MNASETVSTNANETVQDVTTQQHRRYSYQKVLDGRKQPIRGLWVRNGRFIARITAEDSSGKKLVKWVPLGTSNAPAVTVAQAKEAFRRLLSQRDDGKLPVLKRTPKFAEYVETYFVRVKDKKRGATIEKERGALKLWIGQFGGLRIDQIRKSHVNDLVAKRFAAGISGRTVNLDVIALRNVMNQAIDDDWLKVSPLENFRPVSWETKTRGLVAAEDIERLCQAAFQKRKNEDGAMVPVTRNAQQFADYIRLMAYCGSRRDETLRLRWSDVNWALRQLTIGADGLSKNGEPRVVDFNADVERLLKEMFARRAPDSEFLFPSPQRGDKDASSKTFKESLDRARKAAGLARFGFHDCRHFFISHCIMSGIDFMTIARWVGHKDGGVLIGKVYGHLADDHRKRMAEKVVFAPAVFGTPPEPAGNAAVSAA